MAGGLALSLDAYREGADILYENTGNLNKKEKFLKLEGRFCSAGIPHVLYKRGERLYEREEYRRSFMAYHEAGKKGHKESIYNMGYMCRYGIGTERDAAKALQYLLPLAEQGHVPSMGQTAELYFWGELGERNFESAYQWCEKALDRVAERVKRHPNGGVYRYDTILPLMCYCKYFGQGTVIDREMAVRSIMQEKEIAEREDRLPRYKLALLYGLMAEIYANGSGGIGKDKKTAKYYWQKAKEYEEYDKWLGDLVWDKSPEACGARLSWAVFGRPEEERTPLTDVESIRVWQEQRIEQARLSWNGRQPWCLKVKREDERVAGFKCYKALSWYHLGRMYMANPEEKGMEACYYLQRAVDMGLVSALVPLGKCYEKGIGRVKNLQEAISCYDEGIKYDNPAAMAARAELYKQPDGQWENLEKAEELLEKALKYEGNFEGRQEALMLLTEVYMAKGTNEKREMARYILLEEARRGNNEAAYRLAHLYEAEGEDEDYRKILRHTAAEGYEPAQEELKRAYAGSSWSECL